MEEILQQHVLNVVQKMEDRVDDQIHAMDKLQEDDFDSLRQKRLKVTYLQADISPHLGLTFKPTLPGVNNKTA